MKLDNKILLKVEIWRLDDYEESVFVFISYKRIC